MASETSDYYARNGKDYFYQTYRLNSENFLKKFADNLPEKASILDVGCGSGRDLLWLKEKGFHPTGFDRAHELVKLAREHSGCPVIEGDFEFYNFSDLSFDSILASGALVHVTHDRLPAVIMNICRALKPEGFLYISLKKGDGEKADKTGRTFYLWQDASLKKIFNDLSLKVIDLSVSISELKAEDQWLGYILKKK